MAAATSRKNSSAKKLDKLEGSLTLEIWREDSSENLVNDIDLRIESRIAEIMVRFFAVCMQICEIFPVCKSFCIAL